jgi:DNA-binding beta-propeller fold protein YncE
MNAARIARFMSSIRGLGLAALAAGCGGGGNDACDRTAPGNICTIAGNTENGYSGENGPALDARLSLPMDTLAAPDGSLYVDDWNNHRIRKLTADGILHFVAGNGELGGSIDDPATGDFNHPTGIIFDPTGARIYISAWSSSSIPRPARSASRAAMAGAPTSETRVRRAPRR